MRGSRVTGLVVLVATLHVAVFSLALGPRCIAYIAAAYLSAVVIWGGELLLNDRKRRLGFWAGVVTALVVQQVAYRVWKAELAGFWWPLVQFGVVQLLIAMAISEAMKQARRSANLRGR